MKPKSRQENIVVQNLRGETLIYDLKTNKAFCLNETAGFVWQNCDGEKSVSAIAEELARRNRQPVNEDIVWLAIDQLAKDGLMAETESSPEVFAGMNRREIIKKVGLATMIALPLYFRINCADGGTRCIGSNEKSTWSNLFCKFRL